MIYYCIVNLSLFWLLLFIPQTDSVLHPTENSFVGYRFISFFHNFPPLAYFSLGSSSPHNWASAFTVLLRCISLRVFRNKAQPNSLQVSPKDIFPPHATTPPVAFESVHCTLLPEILFHLICCCSTFFVLLCPTHSYIYSCSLLVSQGCHYKVPRTGWLKQ